MSVGYLSNYQMIRDRYKRYLSGRQSKKLLDLSQRYSRQNSFNRVAAASALRTGFQQGFRGLQNTGMSNSGEVERLKRRLGADFTYRNDRLKKNEVGTLNGMGAAFKRSTVRARDAARIEAEKERKGRGMLAKSGQRGMGGGRYFSMTK